ncbi:MAG: hypothetical protein GY696_16075 [Gammaproteobacteria bacterium]|nr:hypothetical protein [Gammaproteobacteria bacterium]
MSEETKQDVTAELLTMIKEMQGNSKSESSGWKKADEEASIKIENVMIPISITTEEGRIRVYLSLSGSAGKSQASLMNAIKQLSDTGLPLDFWRQKKWEKKDKWSR